MFEELMESAKASLNSIFGGKTTERESVVKIEDASFRKLLPYFSYDAENDLYINKQTAGIALELRGYYGADAETLKTFLQYLDKVLPGGQEFHMQCLRLTSHEIYDRLLEIEQASSIKGGLYADFAKYNTRYMTMVAKKGIASRGGYPISLYDTRVFAFISVKYKDKNLDDKIEHLKAIQREALNSKMVKSLPVESFMALLQSLLNPYPGRVQGEVCRYNDLESISSQLCKSGWSMKQEYDRLKFRFLEHPNHYPNKVHSEVVAMGIESFPDKFYLWNMPECFASIRNQHLAISCPHFYTVSFQFMKAFQAQTKATRKVHSDEKNAKSAGFSKYVLNKRREFEEWTMLQGLLKESQVNITLSEFTSSLVLMTTAKDRLRDIKNTQDIFTAAGFNIGPKDGIQLFQYLSALPFMAGEGYFDDAKKLGLRRSMTSFNVANLLPIITDWPGCRSGLIMPTPRNQFSAIDIFSDDMGIADTNMVVGAVPGSGKSVLMQAKLRQVLSQKGGRAWIIDRGNSYKKTCDILGGIYIDKESLNLNPFTFLPVDDSEKLGTLDDALVGVRDLLANMAEPNGGLNEVQVQFLYDAVQIVYQRKKNEGTIDDVCAVLLENFKDEKDARYKDLAIMLKKYTKGQSYGRYFEKGSMLDPEQNLIVVELGDFDQTPDLQKVILCALVNHISKEMYLTGRDVPKMCIIDEAWKFLDGSNPMTSSLIETGFRTSRKHVSFR